MKRYILLIITTLPLLCGAQNYKKMSSYVRQLAQQNSLTVSAKATQSGNVSRNEAEASQQKAVMVFVKAQDESAVSRYCVRHQDDIHICRVPVSELAGLSEDARVMRIEARESNANAHLDLSASKVNAHDAWQGTKLPQAFQGNGTLVGVIDCGIDYMHPTFRSSEDDRLKIVRVWDMIDVPEGQTYNEKSHFPIGTFLNNAKDIERKGSSIDSDIIYHGTHTTSIAAGSGYGSPYSGMAPGADIYSVCIYLSNNKEKIKEEHLSYYTDALEVLAYQNIFDYADSIGKPCVISCSFGGTQDMTDADKMRDDYFSKLTTKGHIIVASAGNDGSRAGYMPKSAQARSVGGRISCTTQSFVMNISTRGKLKMHVTDHSKTIAATRTYTLDFLPGNTQDESPSGLKWYDFLNDEKIPELDNLTIQIYSGNNEFDPTQVGYDIFFYREDKAFNSHNYTVEIESDGVAAEVFCQSGSMLSATQYSPTLTGAISNSGNIGSPGSLPSVICVGSITHANTWTDHNGINRIWSAGSIGGVSSFSSRGPALHVDIKPEVMAPGSIITAGMSHGIYETSPKDNDSHVVSFIERDGVKYPWAIDSGTSMACPVAAGVIALWLEADPTLTREKILDVIANTSRQPDASLSYPNTTYGYGEIDAYKGLLYILDPTGTLPVMRQHADGVTCVPTANGDLLITMPQGIQGNQSVRLYSTSGQLLHSALLPAGTESLTLSTQHLHGIIAVQIGTLGSTLVRLP